MNKSIAVALSCLLAIAVARADDMGKKEPMPMEPKMAPKVQQKHAMKKKPMQNEAMKQKAMKKDDAAMKTMPHDDMGKEMPMQPAATSR
jgi:hypothetical protein